MPRATESPPAADAEPLRPAPAESFRFGTEIVRPALRTAEFTDATWTAVDCEIAEKLKAHRLHEIIEFGHIHDAGTTFTNTIADVIERTAAPAAVPAARAAPHRRRVRTAPEVAAVRAKVRELRREVRQTGSVESKRSLRAALRLLGVCKRKCAEKIEENARQRDRQAYKKDPAGFMRKLNEPEPVEPKFTQAECEAYFSEVLGDPRHDEPFKSEDWMPPRPTPTVEYTWFSVAVSNVRAALRRKKNKSAPGPDGIRYLVFKRCPRLLPYLSHLYAQFIKQRVFPDSCKYGVVSLLFKAEPSTSPANFRPICLANTVGKLFMSMFTQSLTAWARTAGVIDTSWQKGFMPGMPGCVEHASRAVGALQDAKSSGRSLVAVMIDLANAFGSVPHAGILYALKWSGLPRDVQELIQNYYASLRVIIRTRAWTTRSIQQLVGVFQGCPLSVIIFLLFLNILYAWYALPEHKHMGYKFQKSSLSILGTAFADDISLFVRRIQYLQQLLDGTDRFLRWARMKAKPAKCKAIAYKKGETRVECYNPFVRISGVEVPMVTADEGFKLLGKWFYPNLKLDQQEQMIVKKLTDNIERLDKTNLAGSQRVHALRMSIGGWLGWELSMYPFSITFVTQQLEQPIKNAIARWLKLPNCTSKELFFLSRRYHGLNVPSPLTMFKQRQAATMHMLKHSTDPAVREFYEIERRRVSSSQRWSGILAVEAFDAERGVDDDDDEPANPATERRRLNAFVRAQDDKSRWKHLSELVIQGKGLTALECASHDPDWMDQVLQVSPTLFRFGCTALLDVLPTNCNLFRWRKRADKFCPLCSWPQTTLHVLNNCVPQLDKYAWRHDSVLQAIVSFVLQHLSDGLRLLVDLDGHPNRYKLFPTAIHITTQRPDIVLIDETAKQVALIELTMPAEENIVAAAQRKQVKYRELTDELHLAGWPTLLCTIEIGSRGNMRDSLSRAMAALRKTKFVRKYEAAAFKSLSMRCSMIALRASYMIWLTRGSADLPETQPLLS